MTLRLHYNEHTAGCSESAARALRALSALDIATYADDSRAADAISRWFHVPPNWVLPVNGLDEGIQLAAQMAAMESSFSYDALVVEPAFEMYAQVVATSGGRVIRVMPVGDFAFDPEQVIAASTRETRLLFLCDPNNPTGLGLRRGDIEAIAARLPETTIFVDEAYADFSGRSVIGDTLTRYPNLVVGRTFAKAHGLAGLRIGALVGAPETIGRLRRLALPYRVNVAAAVALEQALDDRAHFERTIADAADAREWLRSACRRLGFDTWASEANFLLIRIGDRVVQCAAWMAERGVRVRDRSALPGCAGCVRVTTNRRAETDIVISLLERWRETERS